MIERFHALFGLRKFRSNRQNTINCALERRFHLLVLMSTSQYNSSFILNLILLFRWRKIFMLSITSCSWSRNHICRFSTSFITTRSDTKMIIFKNSMYNKGGWSNSSRSFGDLRPILCSWIEIKTCLSYNGKHWTK